MSQKIGVRREDKYEWEKRVPLVPDDVGRLMRAGDLRIVVQSSRRRIFPDDDYRHAGAEVLDDLSTCPIIVGIKEIPVEVFEENKVYVFFSHTIKGQEYNMEMLKRMLELSCTLIDYEKVTDEEGKRLIFFGNFAGFAGMIDTLWALGKRLAAEGVETPFKDVRRALDYPSLLEAKAAIEEVGDRIAEEGLPDDLAPLVFGIAGYGNVSRGAQEILDLLPCQEISPVDLLTLQDEQVAGNLVYKAVFKEEDIARRVGADGAFELQEYYDHPERYEGAFSRFLPHLTVLVNAIYWDKSYPRLVTVKGLKEMKRPRRLRVIGDISCDVGGAIECTVKTTDPHDPVYVYDVSTGRTVGGVSGEGPVIMAVEILPAELPREASAYFSSVLSEYIPAIAQADYTAGYEECDLPPEIKRAVIAYRGRLAPDYRYLEEHLGQFAERRGRPA